MSYYYSYYIISIIIDIFDNRCIYNPESLYIHPPLSVYQTSHSLWFRFRVILSWDSVLFFTCPFYFLLPIFYFLLLLFNQIDWFACPLRVSNNQPKTTQNNNPSTINLLPRHSKYHTKCVTKSSSATPFANVSTSNTPSTLALRTASAAMEYKKKPSWLVIPVTSTRGGGSMLFRLVRNGPIPGMGVMIWVEMRVGVGVRMRNIGRFETDYLCIMAVPYHSTGVSGLFRIIFVLSFFLSEVQWCVSNGHSSGSYCRHWCWWLPVPESWWALLCALLFCALAMSWSLWTALWIIDWFHCLDLLNRVLRTTKMGQCEMLVHVWNGECRASVRTRTGNERWYVWDYVICDAWGYAVWTMANEGAWCFQDIMHYERFFCLWTSLSPYALLF